MIDINLSHAEAIMNSFHIDTVEAYGYEQEFYALNLTNKEQAIYAIRKWICIRPFPDTLQNSPTWGYQIKEAGRYLLTKEQPWSGAWLPGIEGDASFKQYPIEYWKREMLKFYHLVWQEFFPDEVYKPADLSQYRQRVDSGFEQFPHMPELWGVPEYKPWA
jgi:hypothetical protein